MDRARLSHACENSWEMYRRNLEDSLKKNSWQIIDFMSNLRIIKYKCHVYPTFILKGSIARVIWNTEWNRIVI